MAKGTMGETGSRHHSSTRGNHHRLPRVARTCIFVQNAGLMLGQILLLFVSREAGLLVLIVSGLLGIPLNVHLRLWDSLFVTAFFFVINVIGLLVS